MSSSKLDIDKLATPIIEDMEKNLDEIAAKTGVGEYCDPMYRAA